MAFFRKKFLSRQFLNLGALLIVGHLLACGGISTPVPGLGDNPATLGNAVGDKTEKGDGSDSTDATDSSKTLYSGQGNTGYVPAIIISGPAGDAAFPSNAPTLFGEAKYVGNQIQLKAHVRVWTSFGDHHEYADAPSGLVLRIVNPETKTFLDRQLITVQHDCQDGPDVERSGYFEISLNELGPDSKGYDMYLLPPDIAPSGDQQNFQSCGWVSCLKYKWPSVIHFHLMVAAQLGKEGDDFCPAAPLYFQKIVNSF